ncbi:MULTISPECIES: FAD-dependent oxidoreductase [unclassified Streptomyces]|uniref:FAD-dependent oxidoreductase n=1 Tax=unclassified Streptomyces TaxID=2593676 RepID=UPI003077768E
MFTGADGEGDAGERGPGATRVAEGDVVEAQDARPLARVVSARTAECFTRLHHQRGTRLLFGRGVAALRGDGRGQVTAVELDGADVLPADLVLVGVGVSPCTDLATSAGLPVGDGIITDSRLLTVDPHISAIGDCAAFPQASSGNLSRLESVQNAVGHAESVAARLTGAARRLLGRRVRLTPEDATAKGFSLKEHLARHG